MLERLKKAIAQRTSSENGARGTIIVLIGGYVCYLGIQLPMNTAKGISSMPMGTSVLMMIVLLLFGLAAIAYGFLMLSVGWKQKKTNQQMEEDTEDKSSD